MKDRFPYYLFVCVLISRILVTGPAYFSDGPHHVEAIQSHLYVIQAPGYWLFNRLAGLFPDPEIGISVLNWLFSAWGAVTFYEVSRKMTTVGVARAATIAYVTVFFGWFSGAIHSTFASQLFFPILSMYCILRLWESNRILWGLLLAIAFALGAGLRPSDGAFFAPAFLYGIAKARKPRRTILYLAVAAIGCLGWLVPQQLALKSWADPIHSSIRGQIMNVAAESGPLLAGFTLKALSNFLRYALPLGLGLLPVLLLILKARPSEERRLLWIWILPGSLFFILIYISDPPYLNFILAPFLLLSVIGQASEKSKIRSLALCAAINVTFFLFWRPITPSMSSLRLVSYVVDADLGRCTLYSIQHRRYPLRLRDLMGTDVDLPRPKQ